MTTMFKNRKIQKTFDKVAATIIAWRAAEPTPVPDFETFVNTGSIDMGDDMTLVVLYRLLVDSEDDWKNSDLLAAKRLREVAGVVAHFADESTDTGDAARNVWNRQQRNREILARVAWILATPVSPDEVVNAG